jgi:uncharacterized protein YxjI
MRATRLLKYIPRAVEGAVETSNFSVAPIFATFAQTQHSPFSTALSPTPPPPSPNNNTIQTLPNKTQLSQVLNHPALIITRPVEWANVIIGLEVANRYSILDQEGNLIAHLFEDDGSVGKAISRQLLRTRRPFTATILSPDGQAIIFKLRRPFYLINSTMYIEDGDGNVIGEVLQRWHPFKRLYDLYVDKRQIATIKGGLLAWDFRLEDEQGEMLALIDRNFSGFGKELLTDAGKYVVHFGNYLEDAAELASNIISLAHPDKQKPEPRALLPQIHKKIAHSYANSDNNSSDNNKFALAIPTSTGDQLIVKRPLNLSGRMLALAAAITIDYDYFSRHSHGNGMLSPFIHPPIVPFPLPNMGGGDGGEGGGGEGGGDGGSASPPPPADSTGGDQPLEQDLGSDEFNWEQQSEEPQDESWWGGNDDDNGDDGGYGDDGGDGEGGGGGIFSDLWGGFFDDE